MSLIMNSIDAYEYICDCRSCNRRSIDTMGGLPVTIKTGDVEFNFCGIKCMVEWIKATYPELLE